MWGVVALTVATLTVLLAVRVVLAAGSQFVFVRYVAVGMVTWVQPYLQGIESEELARTAPVDGLNRRGPFLEFALLTGRKISRILDIVGGTSMSVPIRGSEKRRSGAGRRRLIRRYVTRRCARW